MIVATKAAQAEQEVLINTLHGQGQLLGNLTLCMAGHLGEWTYYSIEKPQSRMLVLVSYGDRAIQIAGFRTITYVR